MCTSRKYVRWTYLGRDDRQRSYTAYRRLFLWFLYTPDEPKPYIRITFTSTIDTVHKLEMTYATH